MQKLDEHDYFVIIFVFFFHYSICIFPHIFIRTLSLANNDFLYHKRKDIFFKFKKKIALHMSASISKNKF